MLLPICDVPGMPAFVGVPSVANTMLLLLLTNTPAVARFNDDVACP
jgi:hypothetical protein